MAEVVNGIAWATEDQVPICYLLSFAAGIMTMAAIYIEA